MKKKSKKPKKPWQSLVTCDFSKSSTSFRQPVLICLSREKVKMVLTADTKKKIKKPNRKKKSQEMIVWAAE